jgi:hypothetical protein
VKNQQLSWSGQQDLNLRPDIDSIAGDSDRGSETVPSAGQTSGVILTDIAFGLTPPYRLQRRRAKGWRMPPNTISVTRPGRWGNPFDWRQGVEIGGRGWAKGAAVDLFRQWIFIPNINPRRRQFRRSMRHCVANTWLAGVRRASRATAICFL